MCSGCRKLPPSKVCKACREANNGCIDMRCRDAFIYDPERTDEQIVERLRSEYRIGDNQEGFEMIFKIPEKIQERLNSTQ